MSSARTPVIDGLAARGVVFDHAITASPSTLPSHATMMTGLELPNHGVRTNAKFTLPPERTTLAEILKNNGYATGAVVSTFVLDKQFGLNQGFDEYDDEVRGPDWKPGQESGGRTAVMVTDRAMDWINRHRDRRFFFWAHYFDAHQPHVPPPEYAERFPDRLYDAEIAFIDTELGRLLNHLESTEETRNTVVVVIADHGEGLGEHGEETHSRLLYDTTLRIPWIMTFPASDADPLRIDGVTVGAVDLMPTVLSLLGIGPGVMMDGVDLTACAVAADRMIYVETITPLVYHGWAPLLGLRSREFKYVQAPFSELFDLRADPHERDNLHDRRSQIVESFRAALGARIAPWSPVDDVARTANPLKPEDQKKLAALGYIVTDAAEGDASARLDPKDMVPIFEWLRIGTPDEQNAESRRLLAAAAWTNPVAASDAPVPPLSRVTGGPDRPGSAARPSPTFIDPNNRAMSVRQAALLADAAHRRAPDEVRHRLTLAIAQYRLGRAELARETLDGLDPGPGVWNQGETVERLAYSAMIMIRAGRREEARAAILAAGALSVPGDSDAARALAEAQAMIDASADARPNDGE